MDLAMFERSVFLIAPYLFTAAGLVLCLCLFFSLKRDVHRLAARMVQANASTRASLDELVSRLDDLLSRLQEVERCAALLVPPPPPRSGLNLSARTQAIRLFRRGDDPHRIAAVLGLPRNEVELLIKVHKLAVNGGVRTSEPPPAH